MNYEMFLAFRYLNGLRRSQPSVSVIAAISVLGVAVGVGALLVVLGVMRRQSIAECASLGGPVSREMCAPVVRTRACRAP